MRNLLLAIVDRICGHRRDAAITDAIEAAIARADEGEFIENDVVKDMLRKYSSAKVMAAGGEEDFPKR